MIFGRWMRRRKRVGFAPALLVLLLSVRVATAAAVDCQHELADAAQAHHHAQDRLKIEAIALGGALCLGEENPGVYDDMRAAVGDLPIAYSPRAPPVVALG